MIEPTYAGQRTRGGELRLCGCGALATHEGVFFEPGGPYGFRRVVAYCPTCAVKAALSDHHPPRKFVELPAWRAHSLAYSRWVKAEEERMMEEGQQSWTM